MLNCSPKFNFETCYLQAFAWFSDLLVEHAEIFWSLFAVDMDQVLAEQPPDTWDSFPLFQILNDYLRTDDHDFAKHLEQRLKLMACDMIESCITRTDQAFQQWLKKGTGFVSTDYVLPSEMCAMVNVILDAKNQSFKLCAVDGVDVNMVANSV
ncbi:hypothetical protein O3P69_011787 [Scylla paramamosain]|uniref:MUN domain-containing protein n=1 Tax=Scylla paramamosain TaxID=85552 RepID=A0AAW0SHI2_SCYPA